MIHGMYNNNNNDNNNNNNNNKHRINIFRNTFEIYKINTILSDTNMSVKDTALGYNQPGLL